MSPSLSMPLARPQVAGANQTRPSSAVLPVVSLMDVGTAVLCCACLCVGLIGYLPATSTVRLALTETNAPVPELLDVEFVVETEVPSGANPVAVAPSVEKPSSARTAQTEVPESIPPLPELRPAEALAEARPLTPFEAPVDSVASTKVSQPTVVSTRAPGESETAGGGAAGEVTAAGSSGVTNGPETLVYGEGEGRQPAPTYPARARVAGQQGVVWVQFKVAPDGRVFAAEVQRPSPWSLLNAEALRTVRDRYRFNPGRLRFYEIPIRFELGRATQESRP